MFFSHMLDSQEPSAEEKKQKKNREAKWKIIQFLSIYFIVIC